MSAATKNHHKSHRPGQVRDVIHSHLRAAGRPVASSELSQVVYQRLGEEVPASTIRSCLNLHVGDLWERPARGQYQTLGLDHPVGTADAILHHSVPAAMLILEDCRSGLLRVKDNSLDAIVTDPPYFLDKMGDDWDVDGGSKVTKSSVVGHLPGGMAFSRQQSQELENLMAEVAKIAYDKLKPGGWFLAFTAPRLAHRMASGIELAGYEIRDQWGWLYRRNMPKGMSVKRFVERLPQGGRRPELAEELELWKTPQIKCVIEPVVVAQKPREGTYIENWNKYGVGLVNLGQKVGQDARMSPANLFSIPNDPVRDDYGQPLKVDRHIHDHQRESGLHLSGTIEVPKPKRQYRDASGILKKVEHLSPKPLEIMEHLIRLVVPEGGVVCDPFNGSGSTGIAALAAGRRYIGYEREAPYMSLTKDRFRAEFVDEGLDFEDVATEGGGPVVVTDPSLVDDHLVG